MNAELSTALNDLESKLNALLSSLITSPTAAGAPAAALALLEADDAVSSALDTLRTHQANYARILRLRAEAESLEDKIKNTVRDITGAEKEITEAMGYDDDDDDSDESDDDTDDMIETDSDDESYALKTATKRQTHGMRKRKEVDYRLLLDFARRISKYNKQAAADAAAGAGTRPLKQLREQRQQQQQQQKQQQDGDTDMTGVNGEEPGVDDAEDGGVAAVTKEATSWLDDVANQARQFYMIPYPSEDRIRMGLMGQIQMAAGESETMDPEKEAERMVREAEGTGTAERVPAVQNTTGPKQRHADEAAKAAAQAGASVVEGPRPSAAAPRAPAPALKPRMALDLDLYDPDDDD